MGLFSRLLSKDEKSAPRHRAPASVRASESSDDQRAIERYRYMIQTAPPETIEQAHQEAFERLTPEQRRQVLSAIADATSPSERAALGATSADDPRALARAATRAELREPGTIERTLSRPGFGGLGGSLLGSFAAAFAGSLVAQSFLSAVGFGSGAEPTAVADEQATTAGEEDAGSGEPDVVGDDGSFDLSDFEI
jgi:hypothetical protein